MEEVDRCISIALDLWEKRSEPLEKEFASDIIKEIDDLFYEETDNAVAAGIDKAGSVVRQAYRRLCAERGC
jgi:hypothetical protein